MSYKQNMHPTVSRAEIDVFKKLSAQGLTAGMITQKPIKLSEETEEAHAKYTIPDFSWFEKKKFVYLDGRPVHCKDKAIEWDQEVVDLLEARGFSVLRIPYDPPLAGKELEDVVDQIRAFLGVA